MRNIKNCKSLIELRDALNELTEEQLEHIDLSDLPIFTDNDLANTEEIWSYDDNNVLRVCSGYIHHTCSRDGEFYIEER